MKALNKTATEIFTAIINGIPEGQAHYTLNNAEGSYMALHVEMIGIRELPGLNTSRPYQEYSFAHYGEQNGDLMRDPDVTMLAIKGNDGKLLLIPASYRNDYIGYEERNILYDDDSGTWKINKKAQADLTDFCNTWAVNLREQQGVV